MRLNNKNLLLTGWAAAIAVHFVESLTIASTAKQGYHSTQSRLGLSMFEQSDDLIDASSGKSENDDGMVLSRRKILAALASVPFLSTTFSLPERSSAAVGTLPEFAETNAIVNGLTINVADASQQKAMIDFLIGAFSFEVQRQRIQGSVEETVSTLAELIQEMLQH